MTTYNHAEYLAASIESILQQNYSNIELIIAVDLCHDGTLDIALNYARQYPQVVKVLKQRNRVGATVNAASILDEINGEYFCWFSGDDLMDENKVLSQVKYLSKHPESVACYHDMLLFDDRTDKRLYNYNRDSALHYPSTGHLEKKLIERGCFISTNSYMVRTKVLRRTNFVVEIDPEADWLLIIDIASHGHIGYISNSLARYRIHANNLSSSQDISKKDDALNWLSNHKTHLAQSINKGYIRLSISYFFVYLRSLDFRNCLKELSKAYNSIGDYQDLKFSVSILISILKHHLFTKLVIKWKMFFHQCFDN